MMLTDDEALSWGTERAGEGRDQSSTGHNWSVGSERRVPLAGVATALASERGGRRGGRGGRGLGCRGRSFGAMCNEDICAPSSRPLNARSESSAPLLLVLELPHLDRGRGGLTVDGDAFRGDVFALDDELADFPSFRPFTGAEEAEAEVAPAFCALKLVDGVCTSGHESNLWTVA